MNTPPPVEFRPGMEIVPGYTLIEPLGAGMAGDVWQAQAAGGIKVALKIVRSLSDLGGRKELKALKTIRDIHHPNLCPLFGFWTKDAQGRVLADGETEELTLDSSSTLSGVSPLAPPPPGSGPVTGAGEEIGGTMAIGGMMPESSPVPSPEKPEKKKKKKTAEQLIVVMGLGDCTLYDRLKYVRLEAGIGAHDTDVVCGLDATETIRYLRASASAIDLLNQEHQIYHCDIKPQNILLVGGEAQVCDFGLAKRIEGDMRQTQQAFATPAYAPPEVLHNEGYSRQVDQYSLAVTYYELRTGLLPFDITTHASMLVAKSTGKLRLDALSPAERKVLQKALRRVPSERYNSCIEFINALAVAAGVDKSGGITMGRILGVAAVFLCLLGIGGASWWYFDNQGFRSVFAPGTVQIDNSWAQAQKEYNDTEGKDLSGAYSDLVDAMNGAALVAEASGGEQRTVAEDLFTDAATRLVSLVHGALEQEEAARAVPIDAQTRKGLIESFAAMGVTSLGNSSAEVTDVVEAIGASSIPAGFERWAENKRQQASYREFESLLSAAFVRYCVLTGEPCEMTFVARLRESLDDRPEDFSLRDSIDMQLAVLLPVLATMPADEIARWSGDDWLVDERLEDLIRAEKYTQEFGLDPTYGERWSTTFETFTVAVEPLVTQTDGQTGGVPAHVRSRVLSSFPELRRSRLLVDLRLSAEQLDWARVDQILNQIRSMPGGSERQSTTVAVFDALARDRDAPDALARVLDFIRNEQGIPAEDLRQLRLAPQLQSFMRMLGNNLIDGNSRSPDFCKQIPEALWLLNTLSVEIPEEFCNAAMISLLQLRGTSPISAASVSATDINRLLSLIDSTQSGSALAAAYRLENQIDSPTPDLNLLGSYRTALENGDRALLEKVSPHFRPLILSSALAGLGDPLADSAATLLATSREAFTDLGDQRRFRHTDFLARRAVELSGIDDDELIALRYAGDGNNPKQAVAYLDLAEHLSDNATPQRSDRLSEELLIREAVRSQGSLDRDSVPASIMDRLATGESASELSSQLLRAVHRLGLATLVPRRSTADDSFLIHPATILTTRFGLEKFGPDSPAWSAKDQFFADVIRPTVEKVIASGFRYSQERLLPDNLNEARQHLGPAAIQFCAMAEKAYTDDAANSAYDNPTDYHRNSISLSVWSAFDNSLTATRREQFLIRAARKAVAIPDVQGETLLALAEQFRAFRIPHLPGYLNSQAHYLISMGQRATPGARKRSLLNALEAGESALLSLPESNEELIQHQRYDLLSLCGDLGVQYAFLNKRDQKAGILTVALQRSSDAVDLYNSDWDDSDGIPLLSTYIALGNAHEDLAHYCYVDEDETSEQLRSDHFGAAIEAFTEANSRSPDDVKAKFSLARCQYRRAITIDEPQRSDQLRLASVSLGERPKKSPTDVEEEYDLSLIGEWYHWKIKIDLERQNTDDALQVIDYAREYIDDARVPVDVRSVLAFTCANAYVAGGSPVEGVRLLLSMDDEGPYPWVISRMVLAANLVFKFTVRDNELGSDTSIFTEHLRALNRASRRNLSRDPILFDDTDDEAYDLARTAIRSIREQYARLKDRTRQRTFTKQADLSIGPRVFAESLRDEPDGRYLALAKTIQKGDRAATDRDHLKVFEFVCDLGAVVGDLPSPPSYSEDPEYLKRVSSLTIYFAMEFWRMEQEKRLLKDDGSFERGEQAAINYLTPNRRDGLLDCLDSLKKEAEASKFQPAVAFANGAIAKVNELAAQRGETPGP